MSASQPSQGGDSTPGAGNGAAPEAQKPQDAATNPESTGSGEAPGSNPRDYIERFKSNPDWAVEQHQNLQRRAGSVEAEKREMEQWLGRLADLRSNPAFTGDVIRKHLEDYNQVMTDPKLRKVVENYLQTGTAQPPSASADDSDDDEYLTEEQREIRSLKETVGRLEGRLGQVDHTSAVSRMQGHFEKIAASKGLEGASYEKVFDSVRKTVDGWARQGEVGRRALATLQGPEGERQVRRLIAQEIDELGLSEDLALARLRAKGDRLGRLTTDGPGSVASRGDEPPPEHKSALEALEFAMGNPDRMKNLYGE